MELVILSIGLLCITFWEFFSNVFGKLARITVTALFVGLALCATAVMFYIDWKLTCIILFLTSIVVVIDLKRIYNNYGYCDSVFSFYNREIFKVAALVLCMCLASQYATYALIRKDEVANVFFCLAMTGLVAIFDASKQFAVGTSFQPCEDDLVLNGYVVGYHGRKMFGRSRLVIEVDLDEVVKQGPWGKASYFSKTEVKAVNKLATIDAKGRDRIVYYITGLRYNTETYYTGREFIVRYCEPKNVLYVEDELNNNKNALLICGSVGLFAFFACLTYLVRNL